MYKGSQVCKSEAQEFKMCRATPAGKHADPEICEAKVSNFLQCYADQIKSSKANCADSYSNVYSCMQKYVGETD